MTAKQKKFVAAYCEHLNGAKAAIAAGYSKARAKQAAYEILRNEEVKAAINAILEEQAMSSAEAVRRLTDMGRGDLSPFLTRTGDNEYKLDISSRKARKSIGLIKKAEQKRFIVKDRDGNELGAELTMKIELHDAKDAIVKLMEIQGKIVKRHEHTGKDGKPIELITGIRIVDVDGTEL